MIITIDKDKIKYLYDICKVCGLFLKTEKRFMFVIRELTEEIKCLIIFKKVILIIN
jgi:hypothetical protein